MNVFNRTCFLIAFSIATAGCTEDTPDVPPSVSTRTANHVMESCAMRGADDSDPHAASRSAIDRCQQCLDGKVAARKAADPTCKETYRVPSASDISSFKTYIDGWTTFHINERLGALGCSQSNEGEWLASLWVTRCSCEANLTCTNTPTNVATTDAVGQKCGLCIYDETATETIACAISGSTAA